VGGNEQKRKVPSQNLRVKLRINGWPTSYNPEEVQANHLIELRILDTALKANGSQNGEHIAPVIVGSVT
jgi:hypothetical protein